MNLAQIGEFGLIEALQKGLETRAGTRLGIGDDCAVLESLQTPVVTLDTLVEGVHFRRDWTTPRALGRKAMAVNLSDLASSGARPVAAFVSLSVGPRDDFAWIDELYRGFEDAAREWNFTIAGGDTTKSRGDLVISVALVGEVFDQKRGPVLRSGAQIGDRLLVSGTLGDSAAGLAILQAELEALTELSPATRDYLSHRHHEPTPRGSWMQKLLEIDAGAVHAALDLSDGLVGDAAHLAKRSGVRIEIDAEKLPISNPCREAARVLGLEATQWALSGGEDYELLLAVAPEKIESWLRKARAEGVVLTEIGRCVALGNESVVAVFENGRFRATGRAWMHF